MRTYRLMLSPKHEIDVTPYWIAKLRKGELTPLYRWISTLGLFVLLAGGVLFPVLTGWALPELGYTTYLIVAVTFLLACMIAQMILVGTRRLSDPPLFMQALIFVFLVLLGLLFAPANARNTFGHDYAKYLGGLWVMCLLALYYLITVFINTGRKLRWAKLALMAGFVGATLLLAFTTRVNLAVYPIVVFAVPVLSIFAIETRRVFVSVIAGAAAILGLILAIHFAAGPQAFLAVFVAGFMTVLSWLAINNWQFKFSRAQLLADLKNIGRQRRGIRTFVKANLFVVMVAALAGWLVILAAWMLAGHYDLGGLFQKTIQSYIDAANSLKEIKTIIIGNGVDNTQTVTNALAMIIRSQGVVGLFAYIIVAVSGFYLGLQSLGMELKRGRSLWSLPFMVILFAVPAYGLIANPGMAMMILWWVSVGLLAAKQMWDNKSAVLYMMREQLVVRTLVLDKYLPVINAVLIVLVFIGWVYVLSIVAGLAIQGVI